MVAENTRFLMEQKVIVDLKNMDKNRVLQIAQNLKEEAWGFKIHTLVLDFGLEIVTTLKIVTGKKIFLDLKFFDIPSIIAEYARKSADAGADLITVQASIGEKAIDRAKTTIEKMGADTKILVVVNLTSAPKRVEGMFLRREFTNAIDSGADGFVCSVKELRVINSDPTIKRSLKVVTGIRPRFYMIKDDQRKTATPKEAVKAKADLLVIGRPITMSSNPKIALQKIIEEIS